MADRRVPLGAMLAAQALSVTGNRIALLAVPWFVLQTTGSAAQTGLAAAANTVPVILTGLLAGPLVDRAGFRLTSVGADLASGMTIAAIPLLHAVDQLTMPRLLAIVFVGALLDAPGETARRSLLPDAAAHAGVSIDRAASLHDTTYRLTQLLGAPLGGILIATVGPTQALLVDAVSFGLSALLIGVAVRLPDADPPTPDARVGYRTQLGEGWRFLMGSPLLRSIVAVFVGMNAIEVGLTAVVLPTLVDRVYARPIVLGLLIGAVGAGALVGVSWHAAIGHRYPRRAVLVPALLLVGAPKLLLLAAFPPPAVAIVGVLVLSMAMGQVNPIAGAMEYELIPREMRGRVFGLLGVAFVGVAPIGALGAGFLVEALGLRATLLVGAGLYLLVSVVPLVHPLWRDLDHLDPGHRIDVAGT